MQAVSSSCASAPSSEQLADLTAFNIAQQLGRRRVAGGRVGKRRGQGHLNDYPGPHDHPPLPQPLADGPPAEEPPVHEPPEPPPVNAESQPASLEAAIELLTAQQASLAELSASSNSAILAQQSSMQAKITALEKESNVVRRALAGGALVVIAAIFCARAFLNKSRQQRS